MHAIAEPIFPDIVYPAEDFSRHGTFTLFKEVRLVMSQSQALDHRLLCILRELDQRDHIDGTPLHLASWLARNLGLGYGAAREKVRTARALGHLPLLDAAFRDGKLSYSKVRAVTRVATAHNEAELLMIAHRSNADEVERVVRRMKQHERLDDVQAMLRQRSLTYAWDDDGSLVVKARLTPEQGAIWLKALEKAEADFESDDEFDVVHADAMTQALEESLNDRPKTSRTSERFQVVIHVPAGTLCHPNQSTTESTTPSGTGPVAAAIENGPLLHPETVKRLTCDGALVSMLENESGKVLNVGRRTRTIPSAIRRALQARDSQCQFPDCSHTKYLDGHHIVHWSHGGETKLDNLVLLCRRHHRYVHEQGYSVSQSKAGFEFRKP